MTDKILIFASNPKKTSVLELQREMRDSIEAIKRASNREQLIVEVRFAVRPKDLQPALLEVKPRIVHFCGHGVREQGLVLENDLGEQHLVSTEALADLFRHFSSQIECILLNACYTQIQAEAIVKHINYVIGMRQPILDRSAIVFSEGFYGALGAGELIERAYEFGCNRIQLEFSEQLSQSRKLEPVLTEEEGKNQLIPEHLIPLLLKKENPTVIAKTEDVSETQPISSHTKPKGNVISFGNSTTVQGDVVAGDKHVQAEKIEGNQLIVNQSDKEPENHS
ncbi:MAG: CHAT domain-containing protein [Waterburya sp.]